MSDQIHAVFGQEVESGSRSTCERWHGRGGPASLGFRPVRATLAPLLENLGQAVVAILIGVESRFVVERYGGKHGQI